MTDFGTSEESARVQAKDLEVGVWIDGYSFNQSNPVLIQEITRDDLRVGISAAETSSGTMVYRVLRADRPIDAWGRL